MNTLSEQSPPRRWGGRPPVSHEIVLRAIWFVLTKGCIWRKLPAGMGCSGETARTRFAHWQDLGIWQRLHASILEQLYRKQGLNLEVVIVDSTHVRAFGGGADNGPSPVNRRKSDTQGYGIIPRIRRRNTTHGSGLGKVRWVVERTISWLAGRGRFRIRYDRDQQIIHAWNHLALAALCYRVLMRKSV